MTREQAREAAVDTTDIDYQIGVMQACKSGRRTEWRLRGSSTEPWHDSTIPTWDWCHLEYRIKPTAKLRPWTSDEVPIGAWMRTQIDREYRWLIVNSGHRPHRASWLKECEHSTDGGKTWLPCGVMEEAK